MSVVKIADRKQFSRQLVLVSAEQTRPDMTSVISSVRATTALQWSQQRKVSLFYVNKKAQNTARSEGSVSKWLQLDAKVLLRTKSWFKQKFYPTVPTLVRHQIWLVYHSNFRTTL